MPVPDDMLQEFKMYVAGIVWEAIPMIVVAADEAMEWLKNATKVIAKNKPKNRSITWRSPSGLPIEQQKFNVKSRQINTFFDGKRLQPRLQEEVDSIDVRALSNTIPPSFVHSLDASHLHLTIAELANHGITDFACVHDSFGVHPSEVETMSRVIREQFREMYETQGSPLLNFLDANRSNLTTEQYTELRDSIPQQGSLDLSDLVNNQYFFS